MCPLPINSSSAVVATQKGSAPMLAFYNNRIRPLLDAVDKLRDLQVIDEGIRLPTIVVVGDQSSGKSSVLDSLTGINLPKGQGMVTRVPTIIRLQQHSSPEPEISLLYNGKTVHIDETRVESAIRLAFDEIAGVGSGISNTPLNLLVKKSDVPDITMVDLPGIIRVPVHGQHKDIYDQVSEIIMEYIRPEESIILNVIPSGVSFWTCESVVMSRKVDKHGKRTLIVFTKVDEQPEGLLKNISRYDLNIPLGYVCVRNRIGDESYEEAQKEEARLIANHPLISKIDRTMVGIPVLAQKLVAIQGNIINGYLPRIVETTSEMLSNCTSALNEMPKTCSAAEAMWSVIESIRRVLLTQQYDEYEDDKNMHCSSRLAEMLNQYQEDLNRSPQSDNFKDFLLKEEIYQLQETKAVELPNFVAGTTFKAILRKKINGLSSITIGFVENAWTYMKSMILSVLIHHSENYPKLQLCFRKVVDSVIARMEERSLSWVTEYVKMEKLTSYTCSPEYTYDFNKLISQQSSFVDNVYSNKSGTRITIPGFGIVTNADYLKNCKRDILFQAYGLRMQMTAYWKIVLRRFIDGMALHLQLGIHELATQEIKKVIRDELIATNKIMEESPSLVAKRDKLKERVALLRKYKEVLVAAMDKLDID